MAAPTNGATTHGAPGSFKAAIFAARKRNLVAALEARDGCATAFDLARALDLSLADLAAVVAALKADGVVETDAAVRLAKRGAK